MKTDTRLNYKRAFQTQKNDVEAQLDLSYERKNRNLPLQTVQNRICSEKTASLARHQKHNKAQNQIRSLTIRHSSKTEKDKQQQEQHGTTANREHETKQQKQQGRIT